MGAGASSVISACWAWFDFQHLINQAWWCMLITPALGSGGGGPEIHDTLLSNSQDIQCLWFGELSVGEAPHSPSLPRERDSVLSYLTEAKQQLGEVTQSKAEI